MKTNHLLALELQAQWYLYARKRLLEYEVEKSAGLNTLPGSPKEGEDYLNSLRACAYCLYHADLFYMNERFCDLVDHARRDIPDELAFEESWVLAPTGLIVLETNVEIPKMKHQTELYGYVRPTIRAVGWIKVEGGYYFLVMQAFADLVKGKVGFTPWAYLVLRPGDRVLDKIRGFESTSCDQGAYVPGREMEVLHEVRWVYAALHLMSQRLAHHSEHRVSSLVRSMSRRRGLPICLSIRVVSLRRLEEESLASGSGPGREYTCSWVVRGHWRLQPYKTQGDYKWKFIEAYVKGPADKPLKPISRTLYEAKQ